MLKIHPYRTVNDLKNELANLKLEEKEQAERKRLEAEIFKRTRTGKVITFINKLLRVKW